MKIITFLKSYDAALHLLQSSSQRPQLMSVVMQCHPDATSNS